MSKKKIIIAVLVAIVAIALGWYFLYFTKTPVYSLNLAREAVEKHDVNAFKKHVDVDSIIGSGYDDVVAMQLEDPEIKDNPLKGLAEVMFQGLKPKIVPVTFNSKEFNQGVTFNLAMKKLDDGTWQAVKINNFKEFLTLVEQHEKQGKAK